MATSVSTLAKASGGLVDELESTRTSFIEPYAFFVSWQGVLTLAFTGFTPALLDLKHRISRAHPALPPEASGSKWPKTSIGCLKDDITLTPEQFNTLNALCKALSSECFSTSSSSSDSLSSLPKIAMDSAAITIYSQRSLEDVIFLHTVPFSSSQDSEGPNEEEQHRVKLIVGEADAPDYYQAVARDGNRASHYKAAAVGATLIHPLRLTQRGGAGSPRSTKTFMGMQVRGVEELRDRKRLLQAVRRFKSMVDEALPGHYEWFEESSLHITLRAIIL